MVPLLTLTLLLPLASPRDTREERIAALQALAIEAVESPERSKALTTKLAKALDDDDLAVRTECARLLGVGLHPDASLDALGRAVKDVRRLLTQHRKDSGKGSPSVSTTLVDGVPMAAGRAGEIREYAEQVAASLAGLKDDRSSKALLQLADTPFEDLSGRILGRTAIALVQLGDRRSIEGVVDCLRRIDREVRRAGDEGESDDPGTIRVSSSMTGRGVHRLLFPAPDRATAAEIVGALAEMTKNGSLSAPPEAGSEVAQFERWFDSISAQLPEKLGQLGSQD